MNRMLYDAQSDMPVREGTDAELIMCYDANSGVIAVEDGEIVTEYNPRFDLCCTKYRAEKSRCLMYVKGLEVLDGYQELDR